MSVCPFQVWSSGDGLGSLRATRLHARWGGKTASHCEHTPWSVHCNSVRLSAGSFRVCSALYYWRILAILECYCSILFPPLRSTSCGYSAERIKLGVFPFFWDLMFGFGRKWRETKSSNPIRTQDLKKRHDSILGQHLVLSHQPKPLAYTDMLLDACRGRAKWPACSDSMHMSPRISASCWGMQWEAGGRKASGVGQALW